MNSPLGNRRFGYETPTPATTFDDQTMQQCYHLLALQMGPEMENRINDEVNKRTQEIFIKHEKEVSWFKNELSAEKEKNILLSQRCDVSQQQFNTLLNQVDDIRADIMGEKQKNACTVL